MLKPKLGAYNACAISHARIGEAVKSILPFKAGIAGPLSCLYPAKEGLKCLIQTAHRGLGAAEVEAGKVGINAPRRFKPRRLFGVFNRLFIRLVGGFALLKAGRYKDADASPGQ